MVVCAYGLYIPPRLLERSLWLNVHPSLLPRWRGAAPVERAILAGDEETGVTIHETVAELDAGPIAAQEAFDVGDLDAGQVFARSAEVAARLLDAVLESPAFEPQGEDGATYAEKIGPADRELDLGDPRGRVAARPRALAAHRRVGDAARPARDDLEGAARGRRVRARGRPAGGTQPDELRRVPARRPMIAPARRAAFEVVRRVFEEDAYADRALASAVEGLDDRDRALAQRLAYGTVQRTRTIDFGIEQLGQAAGAEARPAGARGAAARRLPARLDRPGRARGRRRRRRARARREARTRRAVHERRHAPARAGRSTASSRRCPRGRSSTRIPTGSPTSGGATSATTTRCR